MPVRVPFLRNVFLVLSLFNVVISQKASISLGGLGCESNECIWVVGTGFGECRVKLLDQDSTFLAELVQPDIVCSDTSATLVIPSSLQQKEEIVVVVVPDVNDLSRNSDGFTVEIKGDQSTPVISEGGLGCSELECIWLKGTGFGDFNCIAHILDANTEQSFSVSGGDILCQDSSVTLVMPEAYRSIAQVQVKIESKNGKISDGFDIIISTVTPAEIKIDGAGLGCDAGQCIWLTGSGFGFRCQVRLFKEDGSLAETLTMENVFCQGESLTLVIPVGMREDTVFRIQVFTSQTESEIFPFTAREEKMVPVIINGGLGCLDNICIWLQPQSKFGFTCQVTLYSEEETYLGVVGASDTSCQDTGVNIVIPLGLRFYSTLKVKVTIEGLESNLYSVVLKEEQKAAPVIKNGGLGCADNICIWLQPEDRFGSDCTVYLYSEEETYLGVVTGSDTSCQDTGVNIVIPLALREYFTLKVKVVVDSQESNLFSVVLKQALVQPVIDDAFLGCEDLECISLSSTGSTFSTVCSVNLYDINKAYLTTVNSADTICSSSSINIIIPENLRGVHESFHVEVSANGQTSDLKYITVLAVITSAELSCNDQCIIIYGRNFVFSSTCSVQMKNNDVLLGMETTSECSPEQVKVPLPANIRNGNTIISIKVFFSSIKTSPFSLSLNAEYSGWSACSSICGGGTRTKTCIGGCSRNLEETCNIFSCNRRFCRNGILENQATTLTCPSGQRILSIEFGSFGTPRGICGSMSIDYSCHSSSAMSSISATCIGQSSCQILVNDQSLGTPSGNCAGSKYLHVAYVCSGGDGGYTNWSPCSTSCGGGTRTRTCTNPSPSGGKDCSDLGPSIMPCNEDPCGDVQTSYLWREYEADTKAGRRNKIPDLSYAGYHHSNIDIPDIKGPVYNLADYGCFPGSNCDVQFQQAIDDARSTGGVIFFPKGKYILGEGTKNWDPTGGRGGAVFHINYSNLIIRGEGSGQTELYFEFLNENAWFWGIQFSGPNSPLKTFLSKSSYRGSHEIFLDSVSSFSEGSVITIRYRYEAQGNEYWFSGMSLDPRWTATAAGPYFFFTCTVTEVIADENRIMIYEPVPYDMVVLNSRTWEVYSYRYIEEVAIESLTISSRWKEIGNFCHHCTALDDYAFNAVRLYQVRNSWMKDVVFDSVNTAVNMDRCTLVTLKDCHMRGEKGHSSFIDLRSFGSLLQDSSSVSSHHGPSCKSASINCVAQRHLLQAGSHVDPHGFWPINSLFDDINMGTFYNMGGSTSNLPHHLGNLVAWNFNHVGETGKSYNYNFWPEPNEQSLDTLFKPVMVGLTGDISSMDFSDLGDYEAFGKRVKPDSLFDAQLALRRFIETGIEFSVLPSDYGPWSEWGPCLGECGTNMAISSSTRHCPGAQCEGDWSRTKPCTIPCNKGTWSSWSSWSTCNGKCKEDPIRKRTRTCPEGSQCEGLHRESEACISTTDCFGCTCTDWTTESKKCDCSSFLINFKRTCAVAEHFFIKPFLDTSLSLSSNGASNLAFSPINGTPFKKDITMLRSANGCIKYGNLVLSDRCNLYEDFYHWNLIPSSEKEDYYVIQSYDDPDTCLTIDGAANTLQYQACSETNDQDNQLFLLQPTKLVDATDQNCPDETKTESCICS